MPSFTFQSVNPRGVVVHAFTVPAAHLDEAYALARGWATSLTEGGPEGKDWSGWSIEILDGFGRCRSSVPMTATGTMEQSQPTRLRAWPIQG